MDEAGSPVADLTAQELEVRLGTRALRINGLTRFHDAPIRIVIVFDESSSMAANWRAALRIVSELLHSLPPNSNVALVGVNSGTPELIETPGAIARYLHNRSRRGAGGWTKLWDLMHIALLALPHPRPTDVIFVVSDGVDTASKLSFHELQREVHAARVRVSGAILVDMLAATPATRIVSPELADLMRETGGWNLTVSPFLRRRERGGRFERSHVESPNLPGFLTTLFDFYYVDVPPEAVASQPGPLAVRALGVRKDHERVLLSAPQHLPTAAP
ncbi:MAG: VWA domain-containing protein [Candidatus Koribacter versatilis]|uniref:VWA domain-containing protein n=1 Tax=Candidatus Korobacter versatilis TaxID=658062 RepID=A0A932A9K9_9BACT|nr:VWA domain-containing protein [Candidatus Koribacter versatilis]